MLYKDCRQHENGVIMHWSDHISKSTMKRVINSYLSYVCVMSTRDDSCLRIHAKAVYLSCLLIQYPNAFLLIKHGQTGQIDKYIYNESVKGNLIVLRDQMVENKLHMTCKILHT